jgi:hypothetical protein
MFLSIKKGIWYGTKGILAIAGAIVGLTWVHGYKKRQDKERVQNLLIHGIPERKNLFHRIGDIWSFFRKKRY